AVAVFRQRPQERGDKGAATGRRDGIDLAVRALFLRLGTHRDKAFIGQPAQCRIDRPEARFGKMLVAAVLEQLLDLIAGGVATREDSQADCAYVHDVSPYRSILVRY